MPLLSQSTLATTRTVSPDLLELRSAGAETLPRWAASRDTVTQMASGVVRFSYFTAQRTETITQLSITTGSPGASASPTLIRYGLYSVAAGGSLTQLGATPSDTTLLSGVNTAYPKAMTAPVQITRGARYAIAAIVMTTLTTACVMSTLVLSATDNGAAPQLCAVITGQTDLASSYTAGQMNATQHVIYAAALP